MKKALALVGKRLTIPCDAATFDAASQVCGKTWQAIGDHKSMLSARNVFMANNELDVFLRDGFGRLHAAVASDIKRHIATLRESGIDFYGYAALPPDYYTAYDPTSLAVAFNCESDIDAENKNAPYYRYSVDEWQNYVHDGFDATNAELKTLLSELKKITDRPDGNDALETFVDSINQTILEALISLRKDGTFDGISYVVIWLSDSGDEIMNRSAKELNPADVYTAYATEFY